MKAVVIGKNSEKPLLLDIADYIYVDDTEQAIAALRREKAGLVIAGKSMAEAQGLLLHLMQFPEPVRLLLTGKNNKHYLIANGRFSLPLKPENKKFKQAFSKQGTPVTI